MAKVVLISWQEIPSMVEVKSGRTRHKVQLSEPFQELIDLIAMKRGLDGSDDYLLHWRRETMADREGDVKEIAEAVASDIEANYASVRAEALANTG